MLGLLFFIHSAIKQKKRADFVQATGNSGGIYCLMVDFAENHGAFPNPETATEVAKAAVNAIPLTGESSNAMFRQLIACGYVQSEGIFFAKTSSSRKPDESFVGNKALAPGECGFSYVVGLSLTSNPSAPLILTPMRPGTTQFDPAPFDGKAVLRTVDGGERWYPIAEDGHVYENGMDIFDSAQPWWGGKAPVIAYPES